MKQRQNRVVALAVCGALALTAIAGVSSALVSKKNVHGEVVDGESFDQVSIRGSDLSNVSITRASMEDTAVHSGTLRGVSIHDSYLEKVGIAKAFLKDSRVKDASLREATLEDVTLCQASVMHFIHTDLCRLVSIPTGGPLMTHAVLLKDAPVKVGPGESYEMEVDAKDMRRLTVTNDPKGLTAFAFDPRAGDASVASLELRVDGEVKETFQLGETIDVSRWDRFTLRVNMAEEGIIDGSTLGLVLDLDGHGLRPAITTLEVVATNLAFAPAELQFNAPFIADAVGRLIVTLPTDEFGNVDRDIDVSLTLDVKDVADQEGTSLVREHLDTHGAVHGDSEFFSENPIRYARPTSPAAHHPATLEKLLRDTVGVEGVTYGAANFHATHIVAIGPSETEIDYRASATNARGEVLSAMTTVVMEPAREDDFTATQFGKDFELPGRGTLLVKFVDGNGNPVEAPEGAVLRITETPMSHNISKQVHADGVTEREVLAASKAVDIPFGNFIPSDYQVCLKGAGREACANNGDLITIRAGEVTEVTLVVR